MKKWLIAAGLLLLALLLIVSSTWLWLTRSTSGARFALARAASALEQLDYGRLSGSLVNGLVMEDLQLEQAGHQVQARRLEVAARVQARRRPVVVVEYLRLQDLELTPASESAPPPADDSSAFALGQLSTPVDIELYALEIDGLRIHVDEPPLQIDRIELAGGWGEQARIDRLDVRSQALGVQARASGAWALRDNGSGQLLLETGLMLDEQLQQDARLELSGPLDALRLELSTSGPAELQASGRLRQLLTAPQLDINLQGRFAGWPELPVALEELKLTLQGEPDRWHATSSGRIEGASLPSGRWDMSLAGDRTTLEIERLDGQVLGGSLHGQGRLDWSQDAPAASARVGFDALDLSSLYPDWPDQGRLAGSVQARSEAGAILIETLQLQARPGTLDVRGQGRIDPNEDQLEIELDWTDFSWPPVSADQQPLIYSESGALQLDGRLSAWRMQLRALIATPDLPQGLLEARATGSMEEAEIESLALTVHEDGQLRAHGQLRWEPTLRTRLALEARALNPGWFLPELPGQIHGQARLELEQNQDQGNNWSGQLKLDHLDGQLREQALSGQGRLALQQGRLDTSRLELALGRNQLQLQARDDQRFELQLQAAAMDQLWPGLSGQAQLQAALDLDQGRAQLDGQLGDLVWHDLKLAEADVDLQLNWQEASQPAIVLTLVSGALVMAGEELLQGAQLELDGNCDSHRLDLVLDSDRGQADLQAQGQLPGCLEEPYNWQGQLETLALSETAAGDWQLQAPAAIRLEGEHLALGKLCLGSRISEDARLCVNEVDAGAHGRAVAQLQDVPADLFLLPLDPLFSLTPTISGQLEAGWDAAGLSMLEGHVEWSSGALLSPEDETELLHIDHLRIDIEPLSNRGLRIDLDALIETVTEITGRVELVNLHDLGDSRLEGRARINLPDIAAFGHLAPELDRISGQLHGELDLAGPITRPAWQGHLTLTDGQILHAPLGLDVHEIRVRLDGSDEQARLEGHARSGEGELKLAAEGSMGEAGWLFSGRMDGQRFAFAQADWLQLSASPAIALALEPEGMRIDGDIHIDQLRGGLPPGSGERIPAAPDVEILGDPNHQVENSDTGTALNGRLGIDLGTDASLAALGLGTQLAGQLELRWHGPPKPEARGTLLLPEGSYHAYGQLLEISDGEILFSGRAIDDPRLDIRARREIFGDVGVQHAGVHIGGSARHPEIRLFTDPPSSEEKALAYVLTGSDFDHASGQGALNVGFYILPRLLVSYGVGLFETGNVLSGRYELSPRWGIRAVSGERDTGVDLSYTVNN